MSIAIKVENLSKAYQIGQFSTGTLSQDISRWWAISRGKEDPFLKIGEENDRATKGTSDVVWSLRDINLEIREGEAVGIIGKNGAGKSTLLKLLSQVTSPTTGSIKVKGRIASLLEVGTGFHPELTGRENVFLNGAILGMRKKEIQRKFDEIVDFSGVERYIDTPVKRYSSGMYVRLAFAVAAYLESEILIVDEVLAVGDVDFQRKCMGKMGDISESEGRTILFVSHNMASISKLCTQGILLKNGKVDFTGAVDKTIDRYLNENEFSGDDGNTQSDAAFTLKALRLINENGEQVYSFDVNHKLGIQMTVGIRSNEYQSFLCGVNLYGEYSRALLSTAETITDFSGKDEITLVCWLPNHVFSADQQLRLRVNALSAKGNDVVFHYDYLEAMIFNVVEADPDQRVLDVRSKFHSNLSPKLEWERI
jgi:lipopolysaccharide transport system ATP-binding protein